MPTATPRASLAGTLLLVLAALPAVAAPAATGAAEPAVTRPTGTIAFIEDRVRIHTIAADGTDDRVIFGLTPDATSGIQSVAWRPDGQRLAFASGHEELCSIWVSDLYLMDRDGTDVARLTNGPACAQQADLPTGTVRVTIANQLTESSEFTIHAQGLDQAVGAVVQPGYQATFELPVHDLGPDTPQFVVVRDGTSTWFDPGIYADVEAGRTVDAGTLVASGAGFDTWGALTASWSHDGSRIAYQQGLGSAWQIPADAGPLEIGTTLFAADVNGTISATTPTLSPVDDRVLYQRFDTDPSTIDVGRVDAAQVGDAVVAATLVNGLDWLPDGSGFIASDSDASLGAANLYLSDLVTGAITQLTDLRTGFALWPSVSPDGAWVAYSFSAVPLDEATALELRIHHLATGRELVIAPNGLNPDWGP